MDTPIRLKQLIIVFGVFGHSQVVPPSSTETAPTQEIPEVEFASKTRLLQEQPKDQSTESQKIVYPKSYYMHTI